MIKKVGKALLYELWLPVVVVAALWVLSERSNSFYFPSLRVILSTFRQMWLFDRATSDAVPSIRNFLAGLLIAFIVGLVAGLVLGLNDWLYEVVRPVLEFMRAIPGIVLVPVGLALLGIGDSMKIAVIAYGTVWPVLLNTIDGVRALDPLVREMARSFRVGRPQFLLRVVLPGASPQILAGTRISVSLGVVLIIASEYVASTRGIGYVELQSERTFAIPEMWSAMLLLGILGYASNVAFRGIEAYSLRWYVGLRRVAQGGSA